ncbi:MAG: rhomboid family intramembrane serine protease, partial [Anaerolineales bacterium]|nr:rhomboid family intramembrane serine protease [Anaerolineales bacterium]
MSGSPPPQEHRPEEFEAPARPEPQQQGVPIQPAAVTPTVTYALLGITSVIFVAQLLSAQVFGFDVPQALGLKVNERIAQGEIWRLFTPMVLHGSIPHFLFNMYALYIFGRGLERYYGHMRYLALYIVAGFAGNVFSMIFTQAPSLGSSTAIFGLLGAQGVFLYQNRGL